MGRIIEAKAVISGEDRLSPLIDKLNRKMNDFGKSRKLGAEVDRLAKGLAQAEAQMRAIDRFQGSRAPFAAARTHFRAAQRDVERVARELDGARRALAGLQAQAAPKNSPIAREAAEAKKKVAELERQLTTAQRTVKASAANYDRHTEALKEHKRAAEASGVAVGRLGAEHARVKRHIVSTGEAIDRAARAQAVAERQAVRRQEVMARRREVIGALGAGAGVLAASKGKAIGLKAVESAAEFDIAVRKQRVFTDISGSAQAGLLSQAKRIGQETQFSNIDVVKAQTMSMQGLPTSFAPDLKAAVAEGIVENVRNYSTLMETDLKDGADVIRGYLQQTGKDISTKQKALKEANLATNQLVKMAKLGGMDGEDVKNFMNYAGSPGSSAGLSTETLMSLAALARRGGLRGDVAGTFIRTASSKMVAPTNPGLAALNAAGIKFSDYVTMPDRLSTSALEGQFQMKLGKGFTPAIRKRLDAINGNSGLIGDRGKYTEAVVSVVGDMLGKTKNGKVRASDTAKAAKAVGEFHKVSAKRVDTERLLDDAMSKNMTLPQMNAWLTDKHGGKGAITQRQWDEFKAARSEIKKAGNDPDYAGSRAREVMAGLGGSVENLKGSFENFILQLGTANEALIKFSADGLGNAVDSFSKLDQSTQQILTLLGGGAAVSGGAVGAYKLASGLLGSTSSAALDGSAVKLTGAAAALEAAAVRLGGGAAVGAATSGAGAAATAGGGAAVAGLAARTTVLGGLRAAGIAGILGYAGYKGLEALDAWMPTARPGARFSPMGNPIPGKGGEMYGPPMPPTRARSLYEIRNGLPAGGVMPEVRAMPRTSVERPAASYPDLSGQSTILNNTLEKTLAGFEAKFGKPSDAKVEATLKPDQVQANVKPDQVKATIEGKAQVNVTVTVDGPGRVTGLSASSSGDVQANAGTRGRSMPQAGSNPGGY